jgi:hypothetical protein
MIDISLNNNTIEFANGAGKQGFFLGGLGRSEIIADPYIGGYSFLKITYIPEALRSILTNDFKNLLEITLKELTGINDLDLQTAAIQGGFTSNEHRFPTEINKNIFEITCKWQERTGNVFRKPFQQWVTSIRDPETGLYTLSGYGKKNYAIEAIYINCNPSIGSANAETRKKSVESAYYFTGMFPTRVPKSHHNYTQGAHDIADNFEIPFSVNTLEGIKIDEFAKLIVASGDKDSIYWRLQNLPGSTNVDLSINALNNSGILGADSLYQG